jgi:hypothetical protein
MRAWWWYAVGHAVADVHFKKLKYLFSLGLTPSIN